MQTIEQLIGRSLTTEDLETTHIVGPSTMSARRSGTDSVLRAIWGGSRCIGVWLFR